jgi:hypothetical protein
MINGYSIHLYFYVKIKDVFILYYDICHVYLFFLRTPLEKNYTKNNESQNRNQTEFPKGICLL